MSPVPARHVWSLSDTGRRHINLTGRALCYWGWHLGGDMNTADVLAAPACKRCLSRTGGAQ